MSNGRSPAGTSLATETSAAPKASRRVSTLQTRVSAPRVFNSLRRGFWRVSTRQTRATGHPGGRSLATLTIGGEAASTGHKKRWPVPRESACASRACGAGKAAWLVESVRATGVHSSWSEKCEVILARFLRAEAEFRVSNECDIARPDLDEHTLKFRPLPMEAGDLLAEDTTMSW